ncbi:MAG TPA: M28 family peptidase, partial [Blastocatellia bacterium]|nr:M28 family peptidase [Blastocatellia bacterium]
MRSNFKPFVLGLLLVAFMTQPAVMAWQGQSAGTAPASKQASKQAAKPAAALTAAEREYGSRVKTQTIRETTTALAAREMEGRGTATPGGERAARYIADRFAQLGLKPLGESGTYLQPIKFESQQLLPETSFKAGDQQLAFGPDYVISPPFTSEKVDAEGELVFISYGVVATSLNRDDLAGLDLKGKVVVALTRPPANVDKAVWEKVASPQMIFGGLIGRGIAGVILADVGSENEPYSLISNYLSRRQIQPAGQKGLPFKLPPILIISDGGAEKLFAGTGTTYAEAKAKAAAGEKSSRALGKQAAINIRVKREESVGSNVAGLLEGSDAKLKEEAVVYTAHYDAYGLGTKGEVYAGAADNALGVAQIVAIAEAFARAPKRPRRSIIFLAVTGEEHGLLGATHWVNHPTWPVEKVAANINYDGIGTEVYGPVKNVVGFGAEHSTLGAIFESVVVGMGNRVMADPMPEE